MPITTKVVSSNTGAHGEVYSIQHYVIKYVSDLRQLDGFNWRLRFPLKYMFLLVSSFMSILSFVYCLDYANIFCALSNKHLEFF